MRIVVLGLLAALAACTPEAESNQAEAPPAAVALVADGEAATLTPFEADESMQWAASVTGVDFLQNQGDSPGVKLFGLAGGDPAMNGLYTQIAFYRSTAEGWRVFRIGDFLDYRVLADSPGRVDLEIQESTMNANSEIGSRTRPVIVTWTLGAAGEAPEGIVVTPARAAQ